MKIGIFDPYLDTLSGGEKYMLSIASCLAKNNDVSVFWDPSKGDFIKEKAEEKLGINLQKVQFTENIFSPTVSFYSRYIASRKFDSIIYLSDGSIPVVGSNLIIHFQFPVEWIKFSLKTKIKLSRVKKIICNSEFTKSFIDRKLGVRSIILYPPVMVKEVTGIKKENIILHVGRFGMNIEGVNYKKQDVMINAFKTLVKKGIKNWKFILVIGIRDEDKEKISALKELAKEFPIEIVENPPNEILQQLYAKAKIYWHATGFGENLQKHPEHAEHFGISTVEAMHAGAIPVVINAGGQPEIVKNKESGFLWETLEELEEKTILLIKNQKRLEEMAIQAKQRSLAFVGNRFCQQVQEIMT